MAKQLDESLISTLFRVADADRDGAVGGVEAVQFFARSGLPQESLGQVSVMALALRHGSTLPACRGSVRRSRFDSHNRSCLCLVCLSGLGAGQQRRAQAEPGAVRIGAEAGSAGAGAFAPAAVAGHVPSPTASSQMTPA